MNSNKLIPFIFLAIIYWNFLISLVKPRRQKQKQRDIDCLLPLECKLVAYDEHSRQNELDDYFAIKCASRNLSLNWPPDSMLISAHQSECRLFNQTPNKLFWLIDSNVLNVIDQFSMLHFVDRFGKPFSISFVNLKGLSVRQQTDNDEYLEPREEFANYVSIRFERFKFEFYLLSSEYKTRVSSCDDLATYEITAPETVLQTDMTYVNAFRLGFYAVKYPKKGICHSYFQGDCFSF